MVVKEVKLSFSVRSKSYSKLSSTCAMNGCSVSRMKTNQHELYSVWHFIVVSSSAILSLYKEAPEFSCGFGENYEAVVQIELMHIFSHSAFLHWMGFSMGPWYFFDFETPQLITIIHSGYLDRRPCLPVKKLIALRVTLGLKNNRWMAWLFSSQAIFIIAWAWGSTSRKARKS